MQVVLALAALLDMHYNCGGSSSSRGTTATGCGCCGMLSSSPPPSSKKSKQQHDQYRGLYNRIVFITLAIIGAFIAFAFRITSTKTFSNNNNYYYNNFLSSYEADTLWIALLSHHYFKSLEANENKKKSSQKNLTNDKRLYSSIRYDWKKSTEDNYRSSDSKNYGRYADIRDGLDHRFHKVYNKHRQLFQDKIIDSMLHKTHVHDVENGRNCSQPENPWILFTAGAMGCGKSHTIRLLDQKSRFPLHSFVTVDPDQIRHQLPEFDEYAYRNPQKAGELTRKECGMMSEILTKAALQHGRNVLVDGSLRNATWYSQYFQELKRTYPKLRIGIIHVTAPREAVFARALVSGLKKIGLLLYFQNPRVDYRLLTPYL